MKKNGGAGRIRTADRGFADLGLSHLATAPYRLELLRGKKRKMEREKGFEPSTSTLARLHSTTELLPHFQYVMQFSRRFSGGFAPVLKSVPRWSCPEQSEQRGFSLYFLPGVCQTLILFEFIFRTLYQPPDVFAVPDDRDHRGRPANRQIGHRRPEKPAEKWNRRRPGH